MEAVGHTDDEDTDKYSLKTPPLVRSAVVRSKAVVLLLLIYCLMLMPLLLEVLRLSLFYYLVFRDLYSSAIILLSCFTLIVFLIICDC